jgi:hypothetical protein
MKLLSVGETKKKSMTLFPEDHAFPNSHSLAYYFVVVFEVFFSAATLTAVAIILPLSFL